MRRTVKQDFRKAAIARRNGLDAGQRSQWDAAIAHHIMAHEVFQAARGVMGYMAIGSEASEGLVLEAALAQGKAVFLPKVPERPGERMLVGQVDKLSQETLAVFDERYGIWEPRCTFETNDSAWMDKLDVVLVPACACTLDGWRCGYGAGYYDRFLRMLPERVYRLGVVYGAQLVTEIPLESHDVRLDGVVTEDGIFMR